MIQESLSDPTVRSPHGHAQDDLIRDINRVLRAVSPITRQIIWELIPRPLNSGSIGAALALIRQFGGEA